MPLPIDHYRKNRKHDAMNVLGVALDGFGALSEHVDVAAIFTRLVENFGELTHREVEILALGLSWGYVVGRNGGPRTPIDAKDMRRVLPRTVE